MKTYELADLLAVIDTDVQGNIRAIPFSYGAFLLHHGGVWLWLGETKGLTNDEKKEVFTGLGLPDVTPASTSIDGNTVWGIEPDHPLMHMPFTLAQLDEFDKVSCGTISESIKPIDDDDFSAAMIGVNANEIARFLQLREVPIDKAALAQSATPEPVVAKSASNSTTPDPERRLARLRELEGNATYKRGEWKITGITALVESEKGECRKRSDEKTIRADLKEAAENEREAKRANAFTGLGQR